MRFGLLIPQEGVPFDVVLEHALLAEDLGFDHVWVEDHLRTIAVPPGSPAYEGWTTLTALLARTTRIKAGPLVLAETFRNPALLANMAATLDQLSGGRLLLGIGAGGYEAEYKSYGFDWLEGRARADRLAEYLEVINAMWERRAFEGTYYRCDGTEDCPQPLQKPRPPIVVGGKGRSLLEVAARYADVWNAPLLTPQEVGERARMLAAFTPESRKGCATSWYGPCWIDEDEGRVGKRLEKARASENRTVRLYANVAIAGTPQMAIDRIREYEQAGVDEFIFHFGRADVTTGTELFAREVLPRLR
jgi:alkanesulfonate monooxygenase SsuD/methylene tetrahydromethanopterin reductase-like flavin-dependent oxidoreductase (luciferase family)